MDVTRPIKRVQALPREKDLILLPYEKLLNYCTYCGNIGHGHGQGDRTDRLCAPRGERDRDNYPSILRVWANLSPFSKDHRNPSFGDGWSEGFNMRDNGLGKALRSLEGLEQPHFGAAENTQPTRTFALNLRKPGQVKSENSPHQTRTGFSNWRRKRGRGR